jgi:type II secretory pathway pseudopilin PulG
VELLVVVVIILLMLGLAIPVLHVITGSQSEAGAANIIASMLGRARSDAIGLQKPIGVAFIYNPSTQIQTMAEVEFPTCPAWVTGLQVPSLGYVSVTAPSTFVNGAVVPGLTYYYINSSGSTTPYTLPAAPGSPSQSSYGGLQPVYGPPLEIKVDTDLQALPSGVSVQTVCNGTFSNGQRNSDGYLIVGVILFDGQGRLTSLPYSISQYSLLSTSSGVNQSFPGVTGVGVLNYAGRLVQYGVPSQFGLVLYQRNAFVSQNFPTADPSYFGTSYGSDQQAEEVWLDENATPLLINRYTGTLIRAE